MIENQIQNPNFPENSIPLQPPQTPSPTTTPLPSPIPPNSNYVKTVLLIVAIVIIVISLVIFALVRLTAKPTLSPNQNSSTTSTTNESEFLDVTLLEINEEAPTNDIVDITNNNQHLTNNLKLYAYDSFYYHPERLNIYYHSNQTDCENVGKTIEGFRRCRVRFSSDNSEQWWPTWWTKYEVQGVRIIAQATVVPTENDVVINNVIVDDSGSPVSETQRVSIDGETLTVGDIGSPIDGSSITFENGFANDTQIMLGFGFGAFYDSSLSATPLASLYLKVGEDVQPSATISIDELIAQSDEKGDIIATIKLPPGIDYDKYVPVPYSINDNGGLSSTTTIDIDYEANTITFYANSYFRSEGRWVVMLEEYFTQTLPPFPSMEECHRISDGLPGSRWGCGCYDLDDGSEACYPGPASRFIRGKNVAVLESLVGVNGGIIKVENTSTPIDGALLNFPAGTLTKDSKVVVGYNNGVLYQYNHQLKATPRTAIYFRVEGDEKFSDFVEITLPIALGATDTNQLNNLESITPIPYMINSENYMSLGQSFDINTNNRTYTFGTLHDSGLWITELAGDFTDSPSHFSL